MTAAYYSDEAVTLYLGDCVTRTVEDDDWIRGDARPPLTIESMVSGQSAGSGAVRMDQQTPQNGAAGDRPCEQPR